MAATGSVPPSPGEDGNGRHLELKAALCGPPAAGNAGKKKKKKSEKKTYDRPLQEIDTLMGRWSSMRFKEGIIIPRSRALRRTQRFPSAPPGARSRGPFVEQPETNPKACRTIRSSGHE